MTAQHVYTAINEITAEMAKEGISKGRRNAQQGYAFRGIDDVYAALASKLAAHHLCVLPRVMDRNVIERETQRGGTLFYTTLTVEFDFVSSVDGSKHTVCTVGEAMDSADKSSNKAMSAAYKYAAFMAFCIPTEADNDADATTHDVAHRPSEPSSVKSSYALKKDGAWEKLSGELENDLIDCRSLVALERLKADYRERVVGWPKAWTAALKEKFEIHENKLISERERDDVMRDLEGDAQNILMAGE